MTITKHNFSPSVNIIRDRETDLNYIPTPNAQRVFNQLINDYTIGTRSFNIIGSYGSGKSSFIWAFEKNINKRRKDFSELNGHFKELDSFEFLPIIGQYNSIIDTISRQFNKKDIDEEELITELDKYYQTLKKTNKGLLIVIDEFGKFLEFASKTNPERELYFIQQLTEYVNNPDKDIILVITLHQDFNAYALGLSKYQKQEWDKVKGRLKEITFNEPVEQLLYLASERLESIPAKPKAKNFSKLYKTIEQAKVFPLKDYFDQKTAKKLLPFDILSASVLTLALQKYGQNERSLFSFIESNDYLGIKDFNSKNNPYYNLSCVYDYLIYNYYSLLTTKYNPDYANWSSIRKSIERVEGIFDELINDAVKLIKTIGLLNIFAPAHAKIDKRFLVPYSKYTLGVKFPEKIISELESRKIIRYVKHAYKYVLFEGTDVDIELELQKAANSISFDTNIVNELNKYFNFPFIPAKEVYYRTGTPRFFGFLLSEEPLNIEPEGEVDGYINLMFSENLTKEDIREASQSSDHAIIYGFFKNTTQLKELVFEIEKAKFVKEKNIDDRVAVKELDSIIDHDIGLLNSYVLDNLYAPDSSILWYFNGNKINIDSSKSFNRVLSEISDQIYDLTPVYRNEMVNKSNVSTAISTARRNLLKRLVNNNHEKDLGISEKKFPPEKTIYLSLLKNTGMHAEYDDESNSERRFKLREPRVESFNSLWQEGINFLNSAKHNRRNLKDLYEIYLNKPFKLKKGFVDFWVPIFLYINKDEFALFQEDSYIPYLNEDVLDLMIKKPANFEVKTFNLQGSRLNFFNEYRKLINKTHEEKISNITFIETIRPFLILYRDLPEYAKKTKYLSQKAISLRKAIENSKSPEDTFFELFPVALGYSPNKLLEDKGELKKYFLELRSTITQIRSSYDELVNRVEKFLAHEIVGEAIEFPKYKERLQHRYRELKTEVLKPHQLVLYQRIFSELDDRVSWIDSIVYACIGKSLDKFEDEDEIKFYDSLSSLIQELDNYCDISDNAIEFGKEDVYKVEITSLVEGLQKSFIRAPKIKNKEIKKLENEIKSVLSKNSRVNIITLTKLLQEQLKDGEKN